MVVVLLRCDSRFGREVCGKNGGGIFFFFNDTATTEIYTLSLHDALPIWVFHMFFCLGTEGSKGSLFRNGWFQWFSV